MTPSSPPGGERPPRDVHGQRDRVILIQAAAALRRRDTSGHPDARPDPTENRREDPSGELPGNRGLEVTAVAGLAAVLTSAARHVDGLAIGLRSDLLAVADLILQSAR